ncbi:hypothetical protein [Streptomyces sp. NPDC002088]|uniref:hypothetical protein n=1 Tax=Streptomyces sp. NPDC002088 TaxID=3154665 RepID=UPI00331DAB73
MSAPVSHDPKFVTLQDGSSWVRRAMTREGRGLYAVAGAPACCPEYVMASYAELREHGLRAVADVLPMPVGPEPQALSAQQIEALTAAGDRVVNDAMHKHLCMCDAWPEKCVSTANYYMGAWDVSGLETAIPAVLALWEQMRGGERTLDVVEEELTGARLSLWEEEQAYRRLRTAMLAVQRDRRNLRAEVPRLKASLAGAADQIAELESDLGDATARVAELEAAPVTVYRAEHPDSGITLGHYGTETAAREHCETTERRSWPKGTTLAFDWIEDDEDRVAELVVTAGQNEESATGYIVTALELDSEYDEEADE